MNYINLPNKCFKIFLGISFIVVAATLLPTPSLAQTSCTSSANNEGLISALSVGGGTFGNSAQTCVLDPQSVYREFKVPSYTDLEDQFFTLSRSTAKKSSQIGTGTINFSGNGIYLQTSSLSMSGPVAGSGVQIIFVRGDLNITDNINYAGTNPDSGIVFVVSGNINIYSNVTRVNAVLISSGIICTAYESGACLTGTTITPRLTIDGSLISLNKTDLAPGTSAIKMVRNLANNILSAEKINKQPKYLYILRNGLFTKDLVLTEEDKSYAIGANPSPTPTPAPTPTPTPVCAGATDPLVISSNIPVIEACVISIING